MGAWLSEDKQTRLAQVMLQALRQTTDGGIRGDAERAFMEIKRVLADAMAVEARIDEQVRARLASYSRRVPEGSAEWDVLYRKTYEEERRKRNLD